MLSECRYCEEHFGSHDAWRCFHAQYAWPHIKLPVLYLENLYDTANLAFDSSRSAEDEESFRKQLVGSFSSGLKGQAALWSGLPEQISSWLSALRLTNRGRQPRTRSSLSVFAPACRMHETIDRASFWKLQAAGQALAPLLTAWLEIGASVSVIDQHQGPRSLQDCYNASALLTA